MDPISFIGTAMESWLLEPAWQNQLVSGSQVVYTKGWDVSLFKYAGLWLQASSSTTPALRVWYEMSYNDDPNNYVIPTGSSDLFSSLTDKVAHIGVLTIPTMRYLRGCASGSLVNPADVLLNAVAFFHQ